jgi:hypothetical protein
MDMDAVMGERALKRQCVRDAEAQDEEWMKMWCASMAQAVRGVGYVGGRTCWREVKELTWGLRDMQLGVWRGDACGYHYAPSLWHVGLISGPCFTSPFGWYECQACCGQVYVHPRCVRCDASGFRAGWRNCACSLSFLCSCGRGESVARVVAACSEAGAVSVRDCAVRGMAAAALQGVKPEGEVPAYSYLSVGEYDLEEEERTKAVRGRLAMMRNAWTGASRAHAVESVFL